MFKRNKARRCSWRIMEKKKWVYCAMGSQNILNNSPFANHPLYYMCLYSRNLASFLPPRFARPRGNRILALSLSQNRDKKIVELEFCRDQWELFGSKRIPKNEYCIPLRGPWLGRKWCNNTRDRARLSTRTNVPSPIKRHGSVIAEIVRGRYAKRRFRSFIAIENVGQERRMRGKASTFPAIEKKEKFLPVLFLFFFFLWVQHSCSMNMWRWRKEFYCNSWSLE